MDVKEIKAIAKSNDLGVAIVGNQVFEASKYAPGLRVFSTKKWLFLNHYINEMPLSEAAEKVGMTLEQAQEFVSSPLAVKWLERQSVVRAARQKWEGGGEWWVVGDECLDGKKHLSKDQQIVFQAFGDRVAVKPRGDTEQVKTVINFNFTAQDVREAMKREQTFDTEEVA